MITTNQLQNEFTAPASKTLDLADYPLGKWRQRAANTAIAACIFTLVTATPTTSAFDAERIEDPDVRACVEHTTPDDSLVQKVEVETLDDDGPVTESRGAISWKRFEDGRAKVVASIAWPPQRKGVAALLVEREGAKPDIFMYMPERRQVRRVGARMLGTSMLGTDLSYEDFTHFHQMEHTSSAKRLDDAMLDGYPVYVLETIPNENESAYSRILTYVDQEKCSPVKTEFFAPDGAIHKELVVDRQHMREISERWVAFRVVIADHQRERRTVLVTAEVEIDPEIRDSFFTPAELRRGR